MKIALAVENFNPYGGGVEAYAVGLAKRLVENGWEVHLYGHSWNYEPREAIFHRISPLPHFLPPSIRILHFALRHRSMVRSNDFDVVLGFGNTLFMNVYQSHGGVHRFSTMRKIEAVRSPIVRIAKHLLTLISPKYHVRAWIEGSPFRLNKLPVIIAISDMVRRDLSAYFGVREDEIILVYNGADHSKIKAVEEARVIQTRRSLGFQDEVVFLFMAYDLRKKGVHYLLDAAAKLAMGSEVGHFGVLIVGGEPSSAMRSFVKRQGLTKKIMFLGPTTEPQLYFRTCDVLVLPTFYDACSLVVFEALAAGMPIITTRFNGAAGIIKQGVSGFILESPSDTHALTVAMKEFLDRDFLARAKQAAQTDSMSYQLDDNYREMIDIFDAVARKISIS